MRRTVFLPVVLALAAAGPIPGEEAVRLAQAAMAAAGQPVLPMQPPARPLPSCDNTPTVTPFQGRWSAVTLTCEGPGGWRRVLRTGLPQVTADPEGRGTTVPPASAPVMVARHPLRRGAIVTAGDLREAQVAGIDPAQALPLAKLAVGRRLRTAIGEGQPLLERHLAPLLAVEAGQAVTLMIDTGTIAVSIGGEALESGEMGAVIRARVPGSGRVVEGRINGDRILQVGPKSF